jgi:hypothetical protein
MNRKVFSIYLKVLIWLSVVDGVGLTIIYVFSPSDFAVRLWLLAKLFVDIGFIWAARAAIKLSMLECVILLLIVGHLAFGSLVFPSLSPNYSVSRAVRDCLPVIVFFLKVSIIRNILRASPYDTLSIVKLWIPLLVISIIQISIFTVSNWSGAVYAGVTPPLNLPFSFVITHGYLMPLFLIVALAMASGKRAVILSFVAVYIFRLIQQRRYWGVVALVVGVAGAAFVSVAAGFEIAEKFALVGPVIRQVGQGVSSLPSIADGGFRAQLLVATAGRSEEWIPLLEDMGLSEFITGFGAGYGYTYLLFDGTEVQNYANAHFSPLSLTYKFGVLFCMTFYAYLLGHFVRKPSSSDLRRSVVVNMAIWLFIIQSFFSYNLFVESLLPILVAAAQVGVPRNSVR